MSYRDLVIIGGGSAGLNAAISAYESGVHDILIIEQANRLGGILNQCIHNGFGLHWFKEELTGPGFAQKSIDKVHEFGIEYLLNTTVINVSTDSEVEYVSPQGSDIIQAKSVIFSVGCYERSRGAISIPGYRPKGIFTAGSAQKYLNEEGYLVGKKVFILGSGDIGLIMARRMTLEGAKVVGVAELMPYSNGLKRNIVQCLHDYDIPLYLSHTITNIIGKDVLEGIELSEVDDRLLPIAGTEKYFDVDTLLLSVGLVPENSLIEGLKVEMDPITKGPKVDENMQIGIDGMFACGNGLHVHDLVDFVAKEAALAGSSAAKFLLNEDINGKEFNITKGEGIGYILPQRAHVNAKAIELKTRVRKPMSKATIYLKSNGEVIKQMVKVNLFPAEMLDIDIKEDVISKITGDLEVSVVENV
jgi:NADPH-dependent 2,4-dienoyl-CoA reductase/sulfur reductase-like enzyme